jgi:tRNA A22 N-methylase
LIIIALEHKKSSNNGLDGSYWSSINNDTKRVRKPLSPYSISHESIFKNDSKYYNDIFYEFNISIGIDLKIGTLLQKEMLCIRRKWERNIQTLPNMMKNGKGVLKRTKKGKRWRVTSYTILSLTLS